jgi:O-succinylbenzoic acid--CoA ligase
VKITRAGNGCLRIKSPVTGNVWVQTSDLVTIDAAGGFEWSGRIDNLINSGGIKISPEKIEQNIALALLDHDLGDEELNFFVTGWPDKAYGEVVALIFEKSAMSAGFVTKLRDSLSQRLSSYEIPKHFINVGSFVRTRTGKIERTATLSKVLAGEQI